MLTNFLGVLGRYKGEMDYSQFWRYNNGRLPRLITWLVERPDLVEALAADARARKGGDNQEAPAGRLVTRRENGQLVVERVERGDDDEPPF